MKKQKMSFQNPFSEQLLTSKKTHESNMHPSNTLQGPFDFTLQTFRNPIHYAPIVHGEILDCFNNLSSFLKDQPQKNNQQAMRCQKIFKRGDSDCSLPKFSSIQSGQTSINNSLFQDHIVGINQKNRYQCDDQYSFNGDQTQKNYLAPKNTDNKSKYENLIHKIDNFLVKDFNEENTQSLQSWNKRNEFPISHQVKQESRNIFNFKRHRRQKSEKFMKILEQESTVREKLDFLSTYAESLEQENKKLKSEKIQWQQTTKKMQRLEKQVFEKNIVIEFLTKELQKSNRKQSIKQKSDKQNKKMNTNIQKQRNTVSAVNILAKPSNNLPKYRASHHVQTTNEQGNLLKVEAYENKILLQGISGESNHSKSKSNSFMKKIFRKSNEIKINTSNIKSDNQSNQNNEGYLIEILKEENSILSTKLNILYGDFQQMIEKYNQVLTEKNICKAECCKKLRKQSNYIERDDHLGKRSQDLNSKICKNAQDEDQSSLRQIRSILGQITNNQNRIPQMNNQCIEAVQKNQDEYEDQLFSQKDLEKLMAKQRQQSLRRQASSSNTIEQRNYQTQRSMLINEARKNISEFDQIKKSFKNSQNFRFSVQSPQVQSNLYAQRFSTLANNLDQFSKTNGHTTLNNLDVKGQKMQRMTPKTPIQRNYHERVSIWGVK